MRKILLLALSLAFAAVACDKKEPDKTEPAQTEDVKVTNVKLDKNTAKMIVGETMKLTATVYPQNARNKKVSWRSNYEKVATVSSDGTVTALYPGRASIICTTEDGEKTDQCVVDVEAPVIAVTGVSFDVSEITVNEGDSFPLTPVFKPADATERTVTWKSDDTGIATVDDAGKVTAVKVGVTTVSCTTKEGGFVAKCTVRVIQKGNFQVYFNGSEAPSSIDYYLTSVEGDVLGFRLFDKGTSTFLSGADVEISSSETGVANYSGHDDESGFVKAAAPGTATLTFSYKGNAINSVILNVLPKPEYVLYNGAVSEEFEIPEGSTVRINPYPKDTRLILYDKANNRMVTSEDGLSLKSSDTKVATVSVANTGEEIRVSVYGKSAGTATLTIEYNGFTMNYNIVVTYYVIFFEGKECKYDVLNYKMGTNQNNIVRFRMYDHTTKKYLDPKNLKLVPADPTKGVVDSYTETECLLKIKQSGLLAVTCYDISAGVDCYINTIIISVAN